MQVTSFPNAEWTLTLGQAVEELERLDAEATDLEHSTGRYIRPIAVVRVERTGSDQRDSGHIHAEDVRKYLIQNLNVPSDAIRVKSAENDELGRENLLSEFSTGAVDHHKIRTDGRLGLPVCLSVGNVGQYAGTTGDNAAGGAGDASTARTTH